MDRRQFLVASTAITASVVPTLLRAEPAPKEAPKDAFGGFRLGAQTYTFRAFDLEQALKRMQKLGLKYGEFFSKHIPMNANAAALRAFRKICGDYGVTPWAWGVYGFTKDHDANKKMFEFGKALDLKMISADPTPDSFDSLDKLCDEYKIAVGIHPHGPMGKGLHRWYSAEVILAAVKDHHKLIGTCLDTGHLIRAAQMGKKLDPAEQVKIMGARNFGLHLKDHDNTAKHDVVFGKGSLDVKKLIAALREVKFDGMLSIEYEHNEKEPTDDVAECVKVFQSAVKA
jgi:sugar phosphate isomerase/epimerase